MDNHYPTVDVSFISSKINSNSKFEGSIRGATSITFILKGTQPIHKRMIIVCREGQVSYHQATAIAIRLKFMGELLEWLETNRNWKDGGYIAPK